MSKATFVTFSLSLVHETGQFEYIIKSAPIEKIRKVLLENEDVDSVDEVIAEVTFVEQRLNEMMNEVD